MTETASNPYGDSRKWEGSRVETPPREKDTGFGRRPRARNWNPPALDIAISGNEWAVGKPVVPTLASARYTWFMDMLSFYEGVNNLYSIRENYYRQTARTYANLMAAHPPMVAKDGYDAVNRGLAEWVHGMGIDLVRYGTSVAQSWVDNGSVVVEDVFPGLWWPSPSGDVVAKMGPELSQNQRQLTLYDYRDNAAAATYFGVSGNLIQSAEGSVWKDDVLAPHLHRVVRLPRLGRYHGSSMYPDMISLVEERERRDSRMSRILDRHAEPWLHLEVDPMEDISLDPQDGAAASAERILEAVQLWDDKDEGVNAIRSEYKSAKFLTWDAQLLAHQEHRNFISNALYDCTAIPAALQNESRGVLATGTSLRKLYLLLYTQIESMRHIAMPVAHDMANAWAVDLGLGEVSLDEFVWDNPMTTMDNQFYMQGTPQDFEGMPGIDSRINPSAARVGEEANSD